MHGTGQSLPQSERFLERCDGLDMPTARAAQRAERIERAHEDFAWRDRARGPQRVGEQGLGFVEAVGIRQQRRQLRERRGGIDVDPAELRLAQPQSFAVADLRGLAFAEVLVDAAERLQQRRPRQPCR